jgi:hypothetical protein
MVLRAAGAVLLSVVVVEVYREEVLVELAGLNP